MVKPRIESTLLDKLISPGSAFGITFLFLVIQYIFKLELQCPCDPSYNAYFCGMYMFCPAIILFCVLTLTARTGTTFCYGTCWQYPCCKENTCCNNWWKLCWDSFKKTCKNCCNRCCCKRSCPCTPTGYFFFKHITRNAILSFLWIITVLIDGDIIACWKLTDSKKSWHEQIPCKEKENLTPKESSTLKQVQTISQMAGLGLLIALPAVWFIIQCFRLCCCKNPYKYLYEDLYEDEAIALAETNLREKAKSTAKDNYSRHSELTDCKDWIEYSKLMSSYLDKSTPAQQNEVPDQPNEVPDQPNEVPDQPNEVPDQPNEVPDQQNEDPDRQNRNPDQQNEDPDQQNEDPDRQNRNPDQQNEDPDQQNEDPDQQNEDPDRQNEDPDPRPLIPLQDLNC